MIQRLAIFGVGLIGGSFALALKRAGVVEEIVGVGRSRATLERARELGILDTIAQDAAEAMRGCDVAMLAAPVAQTGVILAAMLPHLEARTLVTDAGSTKAGVIAAARAALGKRIGQFVPGHPVAGRERHGPEAALADLYDGRNVVLTPIPENDATQVARVERIWQSCGAIVRRMPADLHDRVLASVSHLPHILAYALVAQIAESAHANLKFDFGGGGFRDFTRIAASSPEMWRDIAIDNRDALLEEIDGYLAMVQRMRGMIERGDAAGLEALFALASEKRLNWIPAGA